MKQEEMVQAENEYQKYLKPGMFNFVHRGKRLDNKEWAIGYYEYSRAGSCHLLWLSTPELCYHQEPTPMDCVKVEDKTIGLCTRLQDKNGEWIFEGDIIVFVEDAFIANRSNGKAQKGTKGIVEACVRNLYDQKFYIKWENFLFDFNRLSPVEFCKFPSVEKIGNIYDNPELLYEGWDFGYRFLGFEFYHPKRLVWG